MPVLAGFDLLGLFVSCYKKGREIKKKREMKNINCAACPEFSLNRF